MPAHSKLVPILLDSLRTRRLTYYSFVISFFVLTFLLQRPCLYCSALLLVLFCSSCSWASSCFFDFNGNWLEPRLFSSPLPGSITSCSGSSAGLATGQGIVGGGHGDNATLVVVAINETTTALAKAVAEGIRARMQSKPDWNSIGMGWMRTLLGREFRLPCINVQVRL